MPRAPLAGARPRSPPRHHVRGEPREPRGPHGRRTAPHLCVTQLCSFSRRAPRRTQLTSRPSSRAVNELIPRRSRAIVHTALGQYKELQEGPASADQKQHTLKHVGLPLLVPPLPPLRRRRSSTNLDALSPTLTNFLTDAPLYSFAGLRRSDIRLGPQETARLAERARALLPQPPSRRPASRRHPAPPSAGPQRHVDARRPALARGHRRVHARHQLVARPDPAAVCSSCGSCVQSLASRGRGASSGGR